MVYMAAVTGTVLTEEQKLGSGIAISGVLLYSLIDDLLKPKKKTDWEARCFFVILERSIPLYCARKRYTLYIVYDRCLELSALHVTEISTKRQRISASSLHLKLNVGSCLLVASVLSYLLL